MSGKKDRAQRIADTARVRAATEGAFATAAAEAPALAAQYAAAGEAALAARVLALPPPELGAAGAPLTVDEIRAVDDDTLVGIALSRLDIPTDDLARLLSLPEISAAFVATAADVGRYWVEPSTVR